MKPIDEKDIATFRLAEDQNRAQKEERLKDLEFFGKDGSAAKQAELELLKKELRASKDSEPVLKRVNDQISNLVDKRICEGKLADNIISHADQKDNFIYAVLQDFDPELKKVCGIKEATDEENIKACSKPPNATKEVNGKVWRLVTRQKDGGEVWRDDATKLVWYPALTERLSQQDAVKACEKLGLKLPSKADFEVAETNGIRQVHTDFKDRWFWSSSVGVYDDRDAWVFYGNSGKSYFGSRGYQGSVRCVRDSR